MDEGFEACDHCGPAVRAYVFVVVNTTEMSYCGSCATRFMDVWVLKGYQVVADLRYMIPR